MFEKCTFYKQLSKWNLLIFFAFFFFFYVFRTFFSVHFGCAKLQPQLRPSAKPISYLNYCDRKRLHLSEPCLCHAELNADLLPVNKSAVKCAMTFGESGRMGNVIGQYAALFTLAKMNARPALITPGMGLLLRKYFKVSLPVLSEDMLQGLSWSWVGIHDWMEDSYKEFPGLYVHLGGYPSSNTFFRGFEKDLRREFALKDEIRDRAQLVLRNISSFRTSTTFIGIHVRRGDYVGLMDGPYHGVLADSEYFIEATDYFRKRYPDAVFLVVSNDMEWCHKNIANDRYDVHFIGNNNESDPITDFAILMNCNHSIVTIGTYGYFAALFSGGETVYFTNFTMPDSHWNPIFRYETAFPAHWHPIAADLSPLYRSLTTLQPTSEPKLTTPSAMAESVVSDSPLVHKNVTYVGVRAGAGALGERVRYVTRKGNATIGPLPTSEAPH